MNTGSAQKAADELGCSLSTVYCAIRGYPNIKLQPGRRPDNDLNKQVFDLYVSGTGISAVADFIDSTTNAVRARIIRYANYIKPDWLPRPRTLHDVLIQHQAVKADTIPLHINCDDRVTLRNLDDYIQRLPRT